MQTITHFRARDGRRRGWRLLAALLLLLPLAAPTAGAQRTIRSVGEDFRNGLADMAWVWASPLRADSRDWLAFAGVVGATGAVATVDGEVQDWLARHPNSVPVEMLRPFREGEQLPIVDLGSGKRLLPVAGLLWVAGVAGDSRGLRDAGIGCAASQQVQTLTHEVALWAVARQRPRPGSEEPYAIGAEPYRFEHFTKTPWAMHSFYGGHGASAMACATFLSERFELGVAEPLLYATAIGIAFARVADGRHWSSDTVLGLAFGHAIGRSIAGRQKARLASRRAADAGAADAGAADAGAADAGGFYVDADGRGMLLGWRRVF